MIVAADAFRELQLQFGCNRCDGLAWPNVCLSVIDLVDAGTLEATESDTVRSLVWAVAARRRENER